VPFENEYVRLIERMRDLKVKEELGDPERAASEAEVRKAMEDFVKETEDLKLLKETGRRFRRPPQTVKETIDTL
jgi:hypothetical protein